MARKKHRSLGGWLMQLLLKLILLGAVLFAVALGLLCLAEGSQPKPDGNSGAVIVLGAQVYPDGLPSPQLELRLEAALKTWQEHPRPIIVCGAQGDNEPAAEGDVMQRWLIAHGVPAGEITTDTESRNTRENLENAIALLPPGVDTVTVVTSDYHLPRALALARDLGLKGDGIGSPCKQEFWVKNHFREVLAWGKYFAEKTGILK